MTIVRRQIPVCVVIKSLYTKLKCAFYGPNEAIFTFIFSPDVSSTYLLLVYLVDSRKNACKGQFSIFFYLHDNEKGKTRLSFH